MEKPKSINISLLILILLFILSQGAFTLNALLVPQEETPVMVLEDENTNDEEVSVLSAQESTNLADIDEDSENNTGDIEDIAAIERQEIINMKKQQTASMQESSDITLALDASTITMQEVQPEQNVTPEKPEIKPVVRYVNANKLNVRKEPTSESELVTSIKRGDKVTYYETIGEWARIITWTDKKGYILAKYLVATEKEVEKPVTVSRGTSGKKTSAEPTKESPPLSEEGLTLAEKICNYAKSLQGIKYVYGGYSTNGFDCSGFTKYVFAQFGINVPRSSKEYWNFGTKVDRENLSAGDIVLFDTNGGAANVSHVGIYLGDGNFIHASTTKKKVIVMNLNSYKGKYMGARRVIK
jgi:cell wall-associated NlpC family hydrolase